MNESQQNQAFHPVHAVNDGIFNSLSGKQINLLNPTTDMICLEDIAGALSKICRFGGQISRFYSVAQHCVLVSFLSPHLRKEALMHDAAEAYLGDLIKPLKVLMGLNYSELEGNFEKVISQKFELANRQDVKDFIKKYDLEALELEHLAFQQNNPLPLMKVMSSFELIIPPVVSDLLDELAWPPKLAEKMFRIRFTGLFNQ